MACHILSLCCHTVGKVLELSKSSLDQISQWVNYGNLTAIALRMVGTIAKLIYMKFFNPSDVGTVDSPNSDEQLSMTASLRQLSKSTV